MNYEIIKDEEELNKFIQFLPELENMECYVLSLFARKKYYSSLRNDSIQLKRAVITTKELFINKIKQMECEIGTYKDFGREIPQESLVLYVTLNPRCMVEASNNLVTIINDAFISEKQKNINFNLHKESLTAIQNSFRKKRYYDFDFDHVNMETTLSEIKKILNEDSFHVLQTKNGFHIIVNISKIETEYRKDWFLKISKLDGLDKKEDKIEKIGNIPVSGCIQGGFIPKLIF